MKKEKKIKQKNREQKEAYISGLTALTRLTGAWKHKNAFMQVLIIQYFIFFL